MDTFAAEEIFLFEGFRLDRRVEVCSGRMEAAVWSS
jgi:hypothetical protein